jgi:hypothetical protein
MAGTALLAAKQIQPLFPEKGRKIAGTLSTTPACAASRKVESS